VTLETVRQDVRFAARTLFATPGVTAAAVATLALGIGLSVAIFSVVQSVVLHQLPFGDPDRLVSVASRSRVDGRQLLRVIDSGDCRCTRRPTRALRAD
jgi:2-hydroxychromene-2-carboxylate isomerase